MADNYIIMHIHLSGGPAGCFGGARQDNPAAAAAALSYSGASTTRRQHTHPRQITNNIALSELSRSVCGARRTVASVRRQRPPGTADLIPPPC
jgi:hypothetical protein